MRFAFTILYVENVAVTVAIWQAAFGLDVDYLHDDKIYAELNTGETKLCFAELEFGRSHFEDASTRAMFDRVPSRFEIGLVTNDVQAQYAQAISAGMVEVRSPFTQPWGRVVAWLQDPNGILIELSSPDD